MTGKKFYVEMSPNLYYLEVIRVFVRRKIGERTLKDCLVPSVKHGGGSAMIRGCFGGCKVGDLVQIKGIMKKDYHSIL